MAVHIKLIKNNIKSSSSYGKYFAKAVSQGEVTLEDIAAEAGLPQQWIFRRFSGRRSDRTAGHSQTTAPRGPDRGPARHRPFQPACGKHRCRRPEGIQHPQSHHPHRLRLSARRAPHPRPAYPLRPLRRSQGRLAERLQTLSSIRCFSASVRL